MTPKPASAIVSAQLVREQAFAYGLWQQRFGAHDVPRLSVLPVSEGGLGYELPASAFRGLVDGYRERMGLGGVSREGRIERQLDELDLLTRVAGKALARAEAHVIINEETGKIHPAPYLDDKAAAVLLRTHEREAKLVGLDAATKIEADVTTHDGTLDDLNAALVRLGKDAIEVE